MRQILSQTGAAIAGMVAGGCLVMAIEWCSAQVYPLPDGIDLADRSALVAFVEELPTGAFVFVIAAWAAGACGGAATARLLTPGRGIRPACVVVTFLLLATIANLVQIPHPAWMWPAGIAVAPLFGALGMWLTASRGESPAIASAPR